LDLCLVGLEKITFTTDVSRISRLIDTTL